MAHPPPSPPPPPPPHPKPPLPTAGKPPTKRKTTATASPPPKRPNRRPPPFPTDIEDTAATKPKFPTEVDIEDLEVMEGLLDFHSTKGVFPFKDLDAMKSFLRPWLLLHIGDEDMWKTKLEKVKNKFTKSSNPITDEERKEFDLWMKIWGNDHNNEEEEEGGSGLK